LAACFAFVCAKLRRRSRPRRAPAAANSDAHAPPSPTLRCGVETRQRKIIDGDTMKPPRYRGLRETDGERSSSIARFRTRRWQLSKPGAVANFFAGTAPTQSDRREFRPAGPYPFTGTPARRLGGCDRSRATLQWSGAARFQEKWRSIPPPRAFIGSRPIQVPLLAPQNFLRQRPRRPVYRCSRQQLERQGPRDW